MLLCRKLVCIIFSQALPCFWNEDLQAYLTSVGTTYKTRLIFHIPHVEYVSRTLGNEIYLFPACLYLFLYKIYLSAY